MRIGILGSGLMGGKLGTILARSGHDVVFSYARSLAKLEQLARDAGGNTRAATPADAAREADVLLLAVHWTRMDDALARAGELSGKILLTCSLPMSEDDSHMVIGHSSSGAEALAERVSGAHIVSAFCTVPSEVLFPVFEARGHISPPDLIFCGDNQGAKKTVARLIRDVGFNPVDVGRLKAARYVEPFGLVVAQIAYGDSERPELAYRFERFPKQAK